MHGLTRGSRMGERHLATGWRLVGRRTSAYLIDIALLFAALGPAGWLTQWALGLTPSTGPQIWATLLLNFSLPTWVYFTASDASSAGATLGKRWLGIRVSRHDDRRLGVMQALGRTAVKLLPWELVHFAAFGLAQGTGQFTTAQGVGLAIANILALAYFAAAVATRGHRSVHDLVVGTNVRIKRGQRPRGRSPARRSRQSVPQTSTTPPIGAVTAGHVTARCR